MLITKDEKLKGKIYLPLKYFYDDYTDVENINDLIIYKGNLYLEVFSLEKLLDYIFLNIFLLYQQFYLVSFSSPICFTIPSFKNKIFATFTSFF